LEPEPRIQTLQSSKAVELPGEEYKALIDHGIKCQVFANDCQRRVQIYQQYKEAADNRITQLTEHSASLEAEKEKRPNMWTVIGLSLLLGVAGGAAIAH
jgi:hypothetical protein